MYKCRNEVERLFRRLKGHRRIFSRFEKLDVMFLGVIGSNLVADELRLCWRPEFVGHRARPTLQHAACR